MVSHSSMPCPEAKTGHHSRCSRCLSCDPCFNPSFGNKHEHAQVSQKNTNTHKFPSFPMPFVVRTRGVASDVACVFTLTCVSTLATRAAMDLQSSMPIGARGPCGMRASDMEVERSDRLPTCLHEFVYLSFHQSASGARVGPCTLRLYDDGRVAFVNDGRGSSGIHGGWDFKPCPADGKITNELQVVFHWNGDQTKCRKMVFLKWAGHSNLWQSVPTNLAGAVVLVETEPTA